jgi:hypothetical protein
MMRRLSLLLNVTWLALASAASAQNLSPEQLARIRLDEKEAMKKIDDAHGGKKSSEMDTAERRQIIREQQEAIQAVRAQHGVSEKDYARQTARMGPKQNAEVAAQAKALEAQRKGKGAAGEEPTDVVPVEIMGTVGQEGEEPAAPAASEEQTGGSEVPVADEGIPVEQLPAAQPGEAPASSERP